MSTHGDVPYETFAQARALLIDAMTQVDALDEARQWAWALKHGEVRVELALAGEPEWLSAPNPPEVLGPVGDLRDILSEHEKRQ